MPEKDESSKTLADRRRVEDSFNFVNAIWKTRGAVTALRHDHQPSYGRALLLGLDRAEIDRVISTIESFYRGGYRNWPAQCFTAGSDYLERGRKTASNNHRQTAVQMLFSSVISAEKNSSRRDRMARLRRSKIPAAKKPFPDSGENKLRV
jgi:hypothetical protein